MPKELLYECRPCQSMHPIKDMLKWPVNQIVDAYIKEVANSSGNSEQQMKEEENQLMNELQDEESLFNKATCDRCEKVKPKFVCYECGSLGSALCEQCSALIH